MKASRYCQTCNAQVVDFTRFTCKECGGTTFRVVHQTIGNRYLERARAIKKRDANGGIYSYYNLSNNKGSSTKRAI